MELVQKEIAYKTYEVEIPAGDLEVNKKEIEANLGYVNNNIPAYFADMVDFALSKVKDLCEIKAGYKIVDAEYDSEQKNGINIGGLFFNLDKIVTSQLKKSTQTALFLCTIGNKMENWSAEFLKEGEATESYIVNTVASTIVENVTNTLHDFIGQKMSEEGLSITNRYSPGYCNWSVSEQQLLFSLLPGNFCGVRLNESSLMSPIKSVSGIIGIGEEVKYQEYICDRCGVKDCTHRIKLIEKTK